MQNRTSSNERAGDTGITTQDIARPVSASEAGADTDAGSGGRTDAARVPGGGHQGRRCRGGRDPRKRGRASGRPRTGGGLGAGRAEEPLLGAEDTTEYHKAWSEIQGRFVDDPQEAVRSADALVAEVMQTLARSFSAHKQGLEEQWGHGGQVATEDLRLALQRYRSFFDRLLNT